jgi:hypothetical protein
MIAFKRVSLRQKNFDVAFWHSDFLVNKFLFSLLNTKYLYVWFFKDAIRLQNFKTLNRSEIFSSFFFTFFEQKNMQRNNTFLTFDLIFQNYPVYELSSFIFFIFPMWILVILYIRWSYKHFHQTLFYSLLIIAQIVFNVVCPPRENV